MSTSMKKPPPRKPTTTQLKRQRAFLVGAALGLYFGLFFRPVREPSVVTIILLSVLITLVMVVIRLLRGERSPRALGRLALVSFVQLGAALAVLAARHPVYDWGGRLAVTIMTTVMGALFGLWWERRQERQKEKSE